MICSCGSGKEARYFSVCIDHYLALLPQIKECLCIDCLLAPLPRAGSYYPIELSCGNEIVSHGNQGRGEFIPLFRSEFWDPSPKANLPVIYAPGLVFEREKPESYSPSPLPPATKIKPDGPVVGIRIKAIVPKEQEFLKEWARASKELDALLRATTPGKICQGGCEECGGELTYDRIHDETVCATSQFADPLFDRRVNLVTGTYIDPRIYPLMLRSPHKIALNGCGLTDLIDHRGKSGRAEINIGNFEKVSISKGIDPLLQEEQELPDGDPEQVPVVEEPESVVDDWDEYKDEPVDEAKDSGIDEEGYDLSESPVWVDYQLSHAEPYPQGPLLYGAIKENDLKRMFGKWSGPVQDGTRWNSDRIKEINAWTRDHIRIYSLNRLNALEPRGKDWLNMIVDGEWIVKPDQINIESLSPRLKLLQKTVERIHIVLRKEWQSSDKFGELPELYKYDWDLWKAIHLRAPIARELKKLPIELRKALKMDQQPNENDRKYGDRMRDTVDACLCRMLKKRAWRLSRSEIVGIKTTSKVDGWEVYFAVLEECRRKNGGLRYNLDFWKGYLEYPLLTFYPGYKIVNCCGQPLLKGT